MCCGYRPDDVLRMPFRRFRELNKAETRRQRRLQVNAMVAARMAQAEGKSFEKVIRSLIDGD